MTAERERDAALIEQLEASGELEELTQRAIGAAHPFHRRRWEGQVPRRNPGLRAAVLRLHRDTCNGAAALVEGVRQLRTALAVRALVEASQ